MKYFSVVMLMLCILACEKRVETQVAANVNQKDSLSISKKDIEKIQFTDFGVDQKAKKTLASWQAYNEVDKAVQDIKTADFTFFISDKEVFTNTLKELDTLPEAINTASIRARLLVVKTKLFRLEEAINLTTTKKNEELALIKEVFQAFSNLTLQINKKFEKEAQHIIKPE